MIHSHSELVSESPIVVLGIEMLKQVQHDSCGGFYMRAIFLRIAPDGAYVGLILHGTRHECRAYNRSSLPGLSSSLVEELKKKESLASV